MNTNCDLLMKACGVICGLFITRIDYCVYIKNITIKNDYENRKGYYG